MRQSETPLIIPPDHPAFAGHFPGAPIVPGVLLLDEVMHAIEAASGLRLTPGQIAAAKFLRPVGPGEALVIRHDVQGNGAVRFEILSGAHKVASGSFAPARNSEGEP
jgi:3-hydroxymyristoyl/3-hydroxydecanoyl-(acyl carrier protein) dehydratase